MGSGDRGALKKLTGAARYWLGVDKPPPQPLRLDDSVAKGLAFFGATSESIEAAQAKEAEAVEVQLDFEVYEDCWESVMFFLMVQTQWCWRLMGGQLDGRSVRAGLNYQGVESAARLAGLRRSTCPALFADLRLIELSVLEADAEVMQAGEQ